MSVHYFILQLYFDLINSKTNGSSICFFIDEKYRDQFPFAMINKEIDSLVMSEVNTFCSSVFVDIVSVCEVCL